MRCAAGEHAFSVETVSHADSDGVSDDPNEVYETSLGRSAGYEAQPTVLVKRNAESMRRDKTEAEGWAALLHPLVTLPSNPRAS